MASSSLLHPLAIFCILISSCLASPRLGSVLRSNTLRNSNDAYTTSFYNQTLDHFNYSPESYLIFHQKYAVNNISWRGANRSDPIFVMLGDKAPMYTDDIFMTDIAPEFHALVIFIEHRFYGDSIPFGMTMDEVMRNSSIRGYFNSAQALADYAEIILYVKNNLNALHSPVVVFGASYGGMLAAWFRLKYPHVAIGAVASSAPVLYFDNIVPEDSYYTVVTRDFRETSETCYRTIRDSWDIIDKIASKPNGLSILRRKFKICSELRHLSKLKNYLIDIYGDAAQYGQPPVYTATVICNAIDSAVKADTLGRIIAGFAASYSDSHRGCYDIDRNATTRSQTTVGWNWQTCSEMVMPVGMGPNSTMFQSSPFSLNDFIKLCQNMYNVAPRPHWITTYYGGHDFKSILKRFGSNIIFTNGLRDPYSSAGVLENISESIVAIKTDKGSHCMDIGHSRTTDPDWLVKQRKEEVMILKGWLKHYYTHLDLS